MPTQTFTISTHASDGDGNTQTASQNGNVLEVLPLGDIFGSTISGKWTTNGSSVEESGLLKVHTYANWSGHSIAASNTFDLVCKVIGNSWSTANYFALDCCTHADAVRFELTSSTRCDAIKIINSSSSSVGNFTVANGDTVWMRITGSGGAAPTFTWYKRNITQGDSDWVQVAQDSFTWDSADTVYPRFGSVGNTTSFHATEILQNISNVYWDTTGDAETSAITWTSPQDILPSKVTFASATGTLRVKYKTRANDGSTWSSYSSYETIAAFQARSVFNEITGLQFSIDANSGGQTAAASIASIYFNTTNPISTLVGARII